MFSSGAVPSPLAAATSSRGGGFPAATPAASAAPRGGGIPPMFSSGAAPTSLAAATSSRGGCFPAATSAASATPRGGGIPPMSSSGAAATSATAATSSCGGGIPAAVSAATTSATSSRGGGTPAAVPAATTSAAAAISSRGGHVSGSGVGPPAVVGAAPTPPASNPSVAAGTATGELLATGQEQLVTSGGRREVLAEVSRMAGGTSPAGPGTSGPPDMVHDGGAGRRWQGQRVTPAVTRSRAKRDGLWPGMFALMATQEDITRSIAELSPPDVVEQELPSDLTCDMETPETYVQAHTGPHSDIWTEGFTYLQSMDFQREPQSKHHLYCEQEKPAHCHGPLLLRLGTHQIQNRTRGAHKISPHGTMTKRTPAMNWDHAVSWGGGLG